MNKCRFRAAKSIAYTVCMYVFVLLLLSSITQTVAICVTQLIGALFVIEGKLMEHLFGLKQRYLART